MADPKQLIDYRMGRLINLGYALAEAEEALAAEIKAVAAKHAHAIAALKARQKEIDKEITVLAKAHHKDVFGDGDVCHLANGSILYRSGDRVVKARAVTVEALKKLPDGRGKAAVKIEKESIDWDVIGKWTDDQLKEIGTRRVPEVKYPYELSAVRLDERAKK